MFQTYIHGRCSPRPGTMMEASSEECQPTDKGRKYLERLAEARALHDLDLRPPSVCKETDEHRLPSFSPAAAAG
jgi:hypothetical protein